MGRDVVSREVRLPQICFNPRSRMGSDNLLRLTDVGEWQVSIHAPTWGATRCRAHRVCSIGSFNPRSHLGSDYVASNDSVGIDVSIHAPTWGATLTKQRLNTTKVVSIHAPTWGATHQDTLVACIVGVSIHAPTWGETTGALTDVYQAKFQPTLPHGERQLCLYNFLFLKCFNPRSRMGSDYEDDKVKH